jgi:uncharacterized protein
MTASAKSQIALIPAMTAPCLASLFYFVYYQGPLAQFLYGSTKVLMVVWPIFCIFYIFHSQDRVPATERKVKLRTSIITGITTGLIIAAGMVLLQTPLHQVMSTSIPLIRSKAVQLGFLDHYWSFAIFLSLGNSLMEEYYWRWFVFGTLRRQCGFVFSTMLCSIAFGAHHFVVLSQYFPPLWTILFGSAVVLGGMFWCFLYEKQKTIWGSWISHVIVDVGLLTIGYQYLTQT